MDMYWEEHKQAMKEWLAEGPTIDVNRRDLTRALYTMNELGLWPDDVTVSEEQALMVWKVINRVAMEAFPDELRM